MPMHVVQIQLGSVFWGSGVVSGIRGKQMTLSLLNEALFSENHDYKRFLLIVNLYVHIF